MLYGVVFFLLDETNYQAEHQSEILNEIEAERYFDFCRQCVGCEPVRIDWITADDIEPDKYSEDILDYGPEDSI